MVKERVGEEIGRKKKRGRRGLERNSARQGSEQTKICSTAVHGKERPEESGSRGEQERKRRGEICILRLFSNTGSGKLKFGPMLFMAKGRKGHSQLI
jgi:hypothetical protein